MKKFIYSEVTSYSGVDTMYAPLYYNVEDLSNKEILIESIEIFKKNLVTSFPQYKFDFRHLNKEITDFIHENNNKFNQSKSKDTRLYDESFRFFAPKLRIPVSKNEDFNAYDFRFFSNKVHSNIQIEFNIFGGFKLLLTFKDKHNGFRVCRVSYQEFKHMDNEDENKPRIYF